YALERQNEQEKRKLGLKLRHGIDCDLTLPRLCSQVSYVALSFSCQLSATNQRTERHISSRLRAHAGASLAFVILPSPRPLVFFTSQVASALAFISRSVSA